MKIVVSGFISNVWSVFATLQKLTCCVDFENEFLTFQPSNIRFGTNNDLTLNDFGFSERIQHNKEVRKNYGTPGFCSPEQVHNEPVSEASDVWSIGATVYTL